MNKLQFISVAKDFALIIGYLDLAISFESYKKVKNDYLIVKKNLLKWINEYNKVNSFDFVTYEESLKLHTILDNVKERILFDKNIGEEKRISDEVLLWYEIVIKKINEEIAFTF